MLDANGTSGADVIEFNIGGGGPQTIRPLSALPTITDPVTFDGSTQPGFVETPLIELDGTLAGDGVDGLRITADNSVVRGLVINRFGGSGVVLEGSKNCAIEGNFIGTDVVGTTALPNEGNGVGIWGGANANVVGTNGDGVADATERNIVSGNAQHGVAILGVGADFNVVAGNFMGTDITGTVALGNGFGTEWGHAVIVASGASSNLIGTDGDGTADDLERNVISGNAMEGVHIGGIDTTNNTVAGNYVGTDVTGTTALSNGSHGVTIGNGATLNLVGTNTDGFGDEAERNVLSGNSGSGVGIWGAETHDNRIAGNFIGTDSSGMVSVSNDQTGVSIWSAQRNEIGGQSSVKRNVISGNAQSGVSITYPGASENLAQGNYIGLDVTGTLTLENRGHGIYLADGSSGNTIGGTVAGAGNVISGNGGNGITISHNFNEGNTILGNYIGTDVSGTVDLGNGGCGIRISDSSENAIGTGEPGAGNLISANDSSGIEITATPYAVFQWRSASGGNDHYYVVSPKTA